MKFVSIMMNFVLMMMDFVLKMMSFVLEDGSNAQLREVAVQGVGADSSI